MIDLTTEPIWVSNLKAKAQRKKRRLLNSKEDSKVSSYGKECREGGRQLIIWLIDISNSSICLILFISISQPPTGQKWMISRMSTGSLLSNELRMKIRMKDPSPEFSKDQRIWEEGRFVEKFFFEFQLVSTSTSTALSTDAPLRAFPWLRLSEFLGLSVHSFLYVFLSFLSIEKIWYLSIPFLLVIRSSVFVFRAGKSNKDDWFQFGRFPASMSPLYSEPNFDAKIAPIKVCGYLIWIWNLEFIP